MFEIGFIIISMCLFFFGLVQHKHPSRASLYRQGGRRRKRRHSRKK
jgi:hypothetical protein